MKKIFLYVFLATVFLFVGTALAGGHGDGSKNTEANSNAEINHSGNNDNNISINGIAGGAGGTANNNTSINSVEGDVTYTSPKNKRSHINSPTGPNGSFIGAPNYIISKDWEMLKNKPLFKEFKPKELDIMREGAGGWFSSGIEKSLRIKKVSKSEIDDKPIVRLDFIPKGNKDKIVGEYEFYAEEPMPIGKAIAHVLHEVKVDTNTHRVVIWIQEERKVENSGLSIGSGVAGSTLWGNDSDTTASAIGLGGLIGKTTARTKKVHGVRVWAFNDGLTYIPKPPCDPNEILKRIEDIGKKIKKCKKPCFNNMRLRFQRANKRAQFAICTGEGNLLTYAIKDLKVAERDYRNGIDIKNYQFLADQLLRKIFWNGAAFIRETEGRKAEHAFAEQKKKKYPELKLFEEVPTDLNEIKE